MSPPPSTPAGPVSPVPFPYQFRTGLTNIPYAANAASGNLFTHRQNAYFEYVVGDWIVPGSVGGFVGCCTGIPQAECPSVRRIIKVSYWANASETIDTWYPSGFEGCASGTGGAGPFTPASCVDVSAFNSFSCMSATVSSIDSMTGLGTGGTISFLPGVFTRAATLTDVESVISRNYTFGMVIDSSPMGNQDEYKDDPGVMTAFIEQLNSWVKTGGNSFISQEELGSPDPDIVPTEGIITWRTDMICAGDVVTVTTSTSTTSTITTSTPWVTQTSLTGTTLTELTTTQTTVTSISWFTTSTTYTETTITTISWFPTSTTPTSLTTPTTLTNTETSTETTLTTQTTLTEGPTTTLTTETTLTTQTTLTASTITTTSS